MKSAKGTVFKYGDNVDTDVIIPARYLNSSDPAELATHCMEDIDKEFVNKVQKGDIIVADKNFGCGSSREHAPIAIKAAGVSCVIAETFARIFYRNAINIGLPIVECPEASKGIEAGDEVEVDFDSGVITNLTKGTTFKGQALSEQASLRKRDALSGSAAAIPESERRRAAAQRKFSERFTTKPAGTLSKQYAIRRPLSEQKSKSIPEWISSRQLRSAKRFSEQLSIL